MSVAVASLFDERVLSLLVLFVLFASIDAPRRDS